MIVVDSGVLIAAADVDDNHHESCARLIAERGREFLVPATVVVEVCWMLGRHVSVSHSKLLCSIPSPRANSRSRSSN